MNVIKYAEMKHNDITSTTRYVVSGNKYEYTKVLTTVYKIEVGVLLEKDDDEFDCYAVAYDKKHGYYDMNVSFEFDYKVALDYANEHIKHNGNRAYAIISRLEYDSEAIYGGTSDFEMDLAVKDILGVLCGGYIEDYIGTFEGDNYSVDNVIYSICKIDGETIKNFVVGGKYE